MKTTLASSSHSSSTIPPSKPDTEKPSQGLKSCSGEISSASASELISDLRNSIKMLEGQIKEKTRVISQMEMELAEIKLQMKKIQEEQLKDKQKFDRERQTLNNDINSLKSQLENAKNKVAGVTPVIESQAPSQVLEKQNKELQSKVAQQEETINKLSVKAREIDSVKASQSDIETLKQQFMDRLSGQENQHREEIKSLKELINQQDSIINNLHEKNLSLSEPSSSISSISPLLSFDVRLFFIFFEDSIDAFRHRTDRARPRKEVERLHPRAQLGGAERVEKSQPMSPENLPLRVCRVFRGHRTQRSLQVRIGEKKVHSDAGGDA